MKLGRQDRAPTAARYRAGHDRSWGGGNRFMMLVCASVVKTGSTWWVQLANEMLARHGGAETEAVRRRWRLGRVIRGDEYRLGALRTHRLVAVLPAARFAPAFAVKTHASATRAFDALRRLDLARSTLNVRDPRDIAVSALEHAEQRRGNQRAPLSGLETIDDAVDFVATQADVFGSWHDRHTTMVRYEDLVADPAREICRLGELMELDLDRAAAASVIEAVDRSTDAGDVRTKYNVGVAGRHQQVMTEVQLRRANRILGPMIAAMGYPAGQL